MNHYCYSWIEDWCRENGWTDLFTLSRNEYWAFPPHGVMPLPIPTQVLRQIKAQRGLSVHEKWWCGSAVMASVVGAVLTYIAHSPMPVVAAFAFCAITVARLEVE